MSVGGRVQTSAPKTAAGRRVIHLDAGLVAVLRAHRERRPRHGWPPGPAGSTRATCSPREDGRPPHPEHFSARFEALCKAAGVAVIRLHDARHSAATLMLAGGVPVKVAAEMPGRSSPTITQSTYQHVLPAMAEDAGARLSGLPAPGRRSGAARLPTETAPEGLSIVGTTGFEPAAP